MRIPLSRRTAGFTLIELLVVIAIIATLSSLAMVGISIAFTNARKAQAKADCSTILTAITSYHTDYGKYPLSAEQTKAGTDTAAVFGAPGGSYTNDKLFDVLRLPYGWNDSEGLNPQKRIYIQQGDARDTSAPKAGISAAPATKGQWMDPWGAPYVVFMDGDYSGDIDVTSCFNGGIGNSGRVQVAAGVASIGLSASKTTPKKPAVHAYDKSTDVVSWQ